MSTMANCRLWTQSTCDKIKFIKFNLILNKQQLNGLGQSDQFAPATTSAKRFAQSVCYFCRLRHNATYHVPVSPWHKRHAANLLVIINNNNKLEEEEEDEEEHEEDDEEEEEEEVEEQSVTWNGHTRVLMCVVLWVVRCE